MLMLHAFPIIECNKQRQIAYRLRSTST